MTAALMAVMMVDSWVVLKVADLAVSTDASMVE
jgi:hypothetical protein